MRHVPFALLAIALAVGPIAAAPVPKGTDKPDPGKTWEFPDLKSKGWKTRDSGLQVWDVKEGDGDEVTAGATVTVNYIGWLTDGTKFDGTPDAGKPVTLPLANVIKGWQDGMVGMKPGGVRRLVIPPELGYGKRSVGKIPGDASLVFVVEYLGPGDK